MTKPTDSSRPELKCIVYAAVLAALALVINIQQTGPAACAIMHSPVAARCQTLFGSNVEPPASSALRAAAARS